MKKNNKFIILGLALFFMAMPVHAFCMMGELKVEDKIINVVHTVVLVIQMVVPILLVIFGLLDLAKGVMAQKEDEIKKGQQTFIKRIVAAVIVFFAIAITRMIIGLVADDEGILDCFNQVVNGSGAAPTPATDPSTGV